MPLSAADIYSAFDMLSEELERRGERAEIVVVGGAALVLLFGARQSTKDVDAYFVRPAASVVRGAAERVASRLELPLDWLNDGAKGFLVGLSVGKVLHESPALIVRSAAIPQLLAMKLAAWRDAIDRSDAMLLLAHMSGSQEEVWTAIQPFVPAGEADKASYAFDDLWEAMHGTR